MKWLLGEDLAHFLVNEPFRDMEHPPTYGQPDRRGYPGYDPDANVHINSGVNNKLCFLLTDGGTFNGQTVTAMGMEKVVDLYYYCQVNLLGPTSDYEDLYADLTLAAINLGMTTAEKNNINAAMLAVEIDP